MKESKLTEYLDKIPEIYDILKSNNAFSMLKN